MVYFMDLLLICFMQRVKVVLVQQLGILWLDLLELLNQILVLLLNVLDLVHLVHDHMTDLSLAIELHLLLLLQYDFHLLIYLLWLNLLLELLN